MILELETGARGQGGSAASIFCSGDVRLWRPEAGDAQLEGRPDQTLPQVSHI